MHILFLPGAQCTSEIWKPLLPHLPAAWDCCFADYAHETLQNACATRDIAAQLSLQLAYTSYDCIVGHSMGGLVALQLAAFGVRAARFILIETNLRPANAFYRNLLLPQNAARHRDALMEMFRREAPYYSVALKQSYQGDFDFTPLVKAAKMPIHILMGDRGQPDYAGRTDDLNLDAESLAKLQFHFIRDTCHLPMLENPWGCAEVIIAVIGNAI